MPLTRLDHVNLRTTRLSAMIDWYEALLGLRNGPRPNFPFAGAWLYAGDFPTVHLVEIDGAEATGSETELKLEHFAFSATDEAAFRQTLEQRDERFKRSEISAIHLAQYNVWDPDGNHIHIDFQTAYA